MVTQKNVQISPIWTFLLFGAVLMANKWQRLLIDKQGLIRPKMAKHHPYKVPFLSKPDDNDLKKQWVVEYAVWSEQREKMVRKRVVISGKTVQDRLNDANEVISFCLSSWNRVTSSNN